MRFQPLTLAGHSVRQDLRANSHNLARCGLVAVLIGAMAVTRSIPFGAPGLRLFSAVLGVDFWCITLLAVGAFASSIVEEREQRTLGLLRMAGFGGASILLGKSLGMLASGLLLIALQVPFAMLCITLGGVAPHQVRSGFLMLGAYLLAVVGVALLCSVLCRRTVSAVRLTGIAVAVLLFLPQVCQSLQLLLGGDPDPTSGGLALALGECSVLRGISAVAETGYDAPLFGPVVQAHLALAVLAFAGAWWAFDAARQDDEVAVGRPTRSRTGRRRPRAPAGAKAVAWKDHWFLHGGAFALGARCAAYFGLLLMIEAYATPRTGGRGAFGSMACTVGLAAVFLEGNLLAGRVFREEVRHKTLGTLGLLPIDASTLVWTKLLAIAPFLLPACAVLAIGLVASPPLFSHILEVVVAGVIAMAFLITVQMTAYFSMLLPRIGLGVTFLTLVALWFGLALSAMACGHMAAVAVWCVSALFITMVVLHLRTCQKVKELIGR